MARADAPGRMLPPLTDANRAFWTGGRDGRLLILRCHACGEWVHPPDSLGHGCGGGLQPAAVSGRGTVWSFTVNRHLWNPAVPPPYVIALVELEEQADLRLVTNIVNCDPAEVGIGMHVQVDFEEQGDVFVPVFEPVNGMS